MAEEQDEQQQQQQYILDDELVPVNEQILKQYSFYNAFTTTADALEMYMQQFWYTITYDLTANAYFFTIGDQVFEVSTDLLHLDCPFTVLGPEKEIIKFINKLRCSKTIRTISALRVNDMYQP
ncbi:hypothetical protein Tco_0062558 [Tanacetum coccineum]